MAFRKDQRITADIVPMEIAEEEDDEFLKPVADLKRNLLGDFNRPSILEPPVPHEHMKVYLRIRPFSENEIDKKENQECLSVLTNSTVSTNPPKDSHFFKNMTRGSCKTTTRYTFSHIFNENTTQKDFFSSTMLGLVKDFIDGQNCLVFSYGVTSSGKTYTIQGNPKDAGVLPRALDVIFNSISKQQWDGMDLKPNMFMDVTRLSPDQEMMERKIKERVLKLSCEDDMDVMSLLGDETSDISIVTNTTTSSESSNISHIDGKDSIDTTDSLFDELATRVREEGKVSVDEQGQVRFSVWVTFAEIYNEQIYDLLEPMPKKKNSRRPCLKLSEDKSGSPYIKGLKHIQVNSADEAYKLLTIGQRNLQTACTKLNHNSSRSHCIFNIKILRVMDKDNPHVARVSMLTLCDLAGSERYGKTKASGERLKEAGNINTSLLTLGRCIETLRYNQTHKDNVKIVPFRESKLTRLFQNFFVGRGKAAMIVNVNQLASMFDETMHVFKFSALASKVEVHQKPVFIKPKLPVKSTPANMPRASISWATPARNHNLKQCEAQNAPLPEEDDDLEDDVEEEDGTIYTQENIDELLGVIEQLQSDLENEIHTKFKMEKQIRKEVCDEMMKQFSEIEEQYSERIRLREQWAEELAEKRIQLVLKAERAKRKDVVNDDNDEWVSSVLLHQEKVKVEKKEEIIQSMQKEIEDLKSKVESLEEENDSQLDDMNKKVACYEEKVQTLEDELAKKQNAEDNSNKADLVENLTQQLQQTRQQIKEQEQEVKELNDMLTEAGETFETKQSEIEKLKELTQEYEKRMEEQAETIKVLERAATDSKVAMETADVSLSKREDCVSTLQKEIRDLEADVNKYRNKARFFEEQIVEKEQEAHQWKTKYEQDIDDHAKSQEALIHGFNAEISNLKSQIFHFKSQLYGVKSPVKSPGGTLRTPDAKMKLFPMSPLSTPSKDVGLNCSIGSNSPAKETLKHTVNEQMKALQGEMDKNCKMISDLEHALQLSKACSEDNEKRLAAETQKCKELEGKLHMAEELSKKCTCSKSVSDCDIVPEMKLLTENCETNEFEAKLKEKDAEIQDLNVKVKELEPLMKDYFSTAKKLTDSEKLVKELQELLEENAVKMTDYENKIKHLECDITDLKKQLTEKEDSFNKLEEKIEEVETLNSELKEVVDKTAFDLLAKDSELQVLSPKLEKLQKINEDEHQSIETLKTDLKTKVKENKELKETISKLKLAYQVKSTSLQEVTEKCSQHEFNCEELQIINQDLQQKAKENSNLIEDLKYQIEKHETEIKTTGEELAIINIDAEKYKKMIEELKVNVTDLESAVADKEVELCNKDKIIADKDNEIYKMKSMNDNVDGEKNELTQKLNKFVSENDKLKINLMEMETKLADLEEDHASKSKENEENYQASMTELTNQKEKMEEDLRNAHEEIMSIKTEASSSEETNGKLVLLESELKNKSEELHCAEKIVTELKEVLKRRDEQLEELHNSLRNSHKNGEKWERDICKKDEQISILQMSVEVNVKKIEGLQSQLAKVQLLLTAKDLELTTLKDRMLAENSSVMKLNDKMKEHESKQMELNNKLEKSVQENEILKQELADVKLLNSQNENALQVHVTENEAFRKEVEEDKLNKEQTDNRLKELQMKVFDLNEANNELKQKISDMKQTKKDDDLKSEVEILKKENKNLDNEITAWKEAADRRDTALQEQIEKIKDIEKRNKELEQEILKGKEVKESDSDMKSQLSMKEVECETLKLELKVLKEQINDTNETSCLSPQTGVRKLRKDKIEIENSLIEARFKISSHESKIKELETKLLNAENTKESTPVNDTLLQQKLNTLTSKLQESETMNMSLLKEVSQLQCQVDKLKADLKEEQDRAVPIERDIHRRSRASMLQAELRQSISSPSSKMELAKSREREHELKEQLGNANTMIQDWLTKLSETENKLSVKTQELKHARETIEALETKMAQSGCKLDQQLQEYMDKNNDLKLQVLKKEGELECCTRTVQNLQRQLDTESGLLKSFEKEKMSQDQFVTVLKETLEEQESMLQVQSDYIEEKESALKQSQSDHKVLLEKYQSLLEKQESGQTEENHVERDILKQQLTEANVDKMKLLEDLKEKKIHVTDVEKKLKKIVEEKDKLTSVIKENNQELKAMECSLTDALKKIEDLKSQGSDKYSDIKMEEMKREAEKTTHDLQAKIRNLQCQKKELEFKLSTHVEKVDSLNGEKHVLEEKLQNFREERDKLVSGLEAVLKKKDTEIKQHKEIIKQLKEKEIQITKSWHDEREQIAAGLQDLNQNAFHVKVEPSMSSSVKEEPVYATVESASKMKSPTRSCTKPPRPSPPKVKFSDEQQSDLEIQPLNQSPGCGRRGIRSTEDTSTPAKPSEETGSTRARRRGKKRQSDEGLEDLPPLPKRQSKDRLSNMSESDDYASHLQVDATPPIAAKTLRRTRKKNGSQVDLSKADDSENQPRRSTRNKRNAKHRLLESFRESPMGKTGKRLLDSIAETFSPKSPTRSPVKSPLREDNSGSQLCIKNSDSRENITCENEGMEKKSGRGRGRHKLYKEDTYISEPFESTGEFVQSQDENIHRTVTRSLRSRRHQNN